MSTANVVTNAPNAKVLGTKIDRLAKRMNTWKKDSHSVAMDVMRHAFSLNGAGLDYYPWPSRDFVEISRYLLMERIRLTLTRR